MAFHVSRAEFGQCVEEALADVPEPFASFLEEVPVEVHDQPTPRENKLGGFKKRTLLLGLYHGRPRTRRSVEDSGVMPDVIYIFQRNIELCCDSADELVRQIRITVFHEIGHHFGMSEEDLEELGYA